MSALPDVVTHYHLRRRPPFLNLSDVPDADLPVLLAEMEQERLQGLSHRRFGKRYMALRRRTEVRLRTLFEDVGGRPQRLSPHYFVLGESAWFQGLSDDMDAVTLPLTALPPDVTSVTYPDSFTAMGLVQEFGLPYEPKPYHGRVFRLVDLPQLVATYGLPNDEADADYAAYAVKPFEQYIEVQVWSDDPVAAHLRQVHRWP